MKINKMLGEISENILGIQKPYSRKHFAVLTTFGIMQVFKRDCSIQILEIAVYSVCCFLVSLVRITDDDTCKLKTRTVPVLILPRPRFFYNYEY